jgi:hypothetical protein
VLQVLLACGQLPRQLHEGIKVVDAASPLDKTSGTLCHSHLPMAPRHVWAQFFGFHSASRHSKKKLSHKCKLPAGCKQQRSAKT